MMRSASKALQAPDADTDLLALQGFHSCSNDFLSWGLAHFLESLQKGFGHAFQNASLEGNIPDAPFYVPLMQTVTLKWP